MAALQTQHLRRAANVALAFFQLFDDEVPLVDRKSTRLNSSHLVISYAVFCLKKKIKMTPTETITSIILIKLITISLGTVSPPPRFVIVVIDLEVSVNQMLRDSISIMVSRTTTH